MHDLIIRSCFIVATSLNTATLTILMTYVIREERRAAAQAAKLKATRITLDNLAGADMAHALRH